MNNETREILNYSYLINRGILKNFETFRDDQKEDIIYHFDCPEYEEIKAKYDLEKIAGNGDAFSKAKRILNHFAPRLNHKSDYDNHVECNSLALLEYCYNKPENGINCLNKSKIFAEICLALKIPARRISIYPFGPFDCDNHVVTEIYDDVRQKWIMMDMTCKNYFINEEGIPLSMLEIRDYFANNKYITSIDGAARSKNYKKIAYDNLYSNWYICKNSFYFMVFQHQWFGDKECKPLYFIPEGFSRRENTIQNMEYRIREFGSQMPDLVPLFEESLEKVKNNPDSLGTDISALLHV